VYAVGIAVYQNFQQAVNRVFLRFAAARPVASTGQATQYVLTDADADAVALVNALEDCLFHGLKVTVVLAFLDCTRVAVLHSGCVFPEIR
jgi:hypothetical protein